MTYPLGLMHPQECNHFVWKDVKKLNFVLTALDTYLNANHNKGHWNAFKLAVLFSRLTPIFL